MSSGFISEAELAEQRRVRQEEWEKVRKPGEPEIIRIDGGRMLAAIKAWRCDVPRRTACQFRVTPERAKQVS